MEQQLINALMKLLSKAGGGALIRDLIQKVDTNGNPKSWTYTETAAAVDYINNQIASFGSAEAMIVVETLIKKYNLDPDRFLSQQGDAPVPDASGIQGLQ